MSKSSNKRIKYGEDLSETERDTDIGKAAKGFEKSLIELGSTKNKRTIFIYKNFTGFIDRNKILLAAASLIYEKFGSTVPPATTFNSSEDVNEYAAQSINLINRYGNKNHVSGMNNNVKVEIYAYTRYIDSEMKKRESKFVVE